MKKHEGFTIIEVSMFLAISAALVLLTVGLSGMVARQRFQDTMISLRTLIRDQYEEVRNGINENDGSVSCVNTSAAGTGGCKVIGRLIMFGCTNLSGCTNDTKSNVVVYYIVGRVEDTANISSSSMFAYITATGSAISPREHQIKWGGEVVSMWKPSSSPSASAAEIGAGTAGRRRNIAIMRDPATGDIVTAVNVDFPAAVPSFSVDGLSLKVGSDIRTPAVLFIKNQQAGLPGAAICFDGSSNSSGVRMAIPWGNGGATPPDVASAANGIDSVCGGNLAL